jgi:hypothetical protein
VTALTGWVRRWYGAHPLHLLALLAAFALAGYAVRAVVAAGHWPGFVIWFVVAIVGHDLLLLPLYTLADQSVRRLLPHRAAAASTRPAGPGGASAPANPAVPQFPPVINYLRIPAGFSVLLLVVWFPLILGLSAASYQGASGLTTRPYLWRWLAVTGVMFTMSAVCYALRMRRASVQARKAS